MAPFRPRLRLLLAALTLAATSAPAASPAPGVPAEPAPAPTPLTQDLFLDLLARDLSAHFSLDGDLRLELLRSWQSPDRVARSWRVVLLDYPPVPAASLLVRCRILADDSLVADSPLVLRAALWRDAWVSRLPLVAGAPFDPARLDVRRLDFFREREAVPAAVGDGSFLFARALPPGRLLTWHDLARRPLVRKGDLVEVSAASGQLNITLKGLALQSGARGEVVLIRNPDSRKDFTAFVIDENRVQVRF